MSSLTVAVVATVDNVEGDPDRGDGNWGETASELG